MGAQAQIFSPVEQLYLNLEDTATLSGSGAYMASLAFLRQCKQTAKDQYRGAKTIVEDLKLRFMARKKMGLFFCYGLAL
jgi:hypothetical protein